jgi:hypothetical protein
MSSRWWPRRMAAISAWTVNEDGYSRLYVRRPRRPASSIDLPAMPAGAIQSLVDVAGRPQARACCCTWRLLPAEIYVVNLDTGSRRHAADVRFSGRHRRGAIWLSRRLSATRRTTAATFPALLYRPEGRRTIRRRRALDPRRAGGAGAAELRLQRAVPVLALAGHRSARAERARLDRLRQDLPEADSPRLGRRRAARLRSRP